MAWRQPVHQQQAGFSLGGAGGSLPSGLGWNDLWLAQAWISVPSTEKCLSDISARTRVCDVGRLTTDRRFPPGEFRFPSLRALAMVEAEMERNGATSLERRYYLSLMPPLKRFPLKTNGKA